MNAVPAFMITASLLPAVMTGAEAMASGECSSPPAHRPYPVKQFLGRDLGCRAIRRLRIALDDGERVRLQLGRVHFQILLDAAIHLLGLQRADPGVGQDQANFHVLRCKCLADHGAASRQGRGHGQESQSLVWTSEAPQFVKERNVDGCIALQPQRYLATIKNIDRVRRPCAQPRSRLLAHLGAVRP